MGNSLRNLFWLVSIDVVFTLSGNTYSQACLREHLLIREDVKNHYQNLSEKIRQEAPRELKAIEKFFVFPSGWYKGQDVRTLKYPELTGQIESIFAGQENVLVKFNLQDSDILRFLKNTQPGDKVCIDHHFFEVEYLNGKKVFKKNSVFSFHYSEEKMQKEILQGEFIYFVNPTRGNTSPAIHRTPEKTWDSQESIPKEALEKLSGIDKNLLPVSKEEFTRLYLMGRPFKSQSVRYNKVEYLIENYDERKGMVLLSRDIVEYKKENDKFRISELKPGELVQFQGKSFQFLGVNQKFKKGILARRELISVPYYDFKSLSETDKSRERSSDLFQGLETHENAERLFQSQIHPSSSTDTSLSLVPKIGEENIIISKISPKDTLIEFSNSTLRDRLVPTRVLTYEFQIENQIFPIEVLITHLNPNEDLTIKIDFIKTLLAQLPKVAAHVITCLNFLDLKSQIDPEGRESKAEYEYQPKFLTIYQPYFVQNSKTPLIFTKIFWHEIGHGIEKDLKKDPGFILRWNRAIIEEAESITDYASFNSGEDQAETIMEYIFSDAGRLESQYRIKHPKRFALLDEYFKVSRRRAMLLSAVEKAKTPEGTQNPSQLEIAQALKAKWIPGSKVRLKNDPSRSAFLLEYQAEALPPWDSILVVGTHASYAELYQELEKSDEIRISFSHSEVGTWLREKNGNFTFIKENTSPLLSIESILKAIQGESISLQDIRDKIQNAEKIELRNHQSSLKSVYKKKTENKDPDKPWMHEIRSYLHSGEVILED